MFREIALIFEMIDSLYKLKMVEGLITFGKSYYKKEKHTTFRIVLRIFFCFEILDFTVFSVFLKKQS